MASIKVSRLHLVDLAGSERQKDTHAEGLRLKVNMSYFCFNSFTPRVSYGDINMILTSESVDEILWCDHSMKPLQQYFHMVLFIFLVSILQNEIWDLS